MIVQIQTAPLYPVYQPLVWLTSGKLAGHEALLRSTGDEFPEYLFRDARAMGHLNELDVWALKQAVTTYFEESSGRSRDSLLFVNVFPSTLLNAAFADFLETVCQRNLHPIGRIVLEINEASEEEKMWDIAMLGRKIRELREHGFLIALDDVGSGAASLRKIVEYEPDIVKLDRFFGQGLAANASKQKLISLFIDYCAGQSLLVLEGLEKSEDVAAARMLGVPIGQGFLIGRPARL